MDSLRDSPILPLSERVAAASASRPGMGTFLPSLVDNNIERLSRSRAFLWLSLALVAVLYLAASGWPAILDQNEGQYAGAAREMLNRPADYVQATRRQLFRGCWLVPTNDGIPRLQKPPLVYWAEMISLRIFGSNDFAARLPNALAALAWFGGIFLIGRRLHGAVFGATASLILATMMGTFIFSHLVMPEVFLAAFLTLTFWCFICACQEPPNAYFWMRLAWLFMGLGCFTKGLHGAGYPLLAAGWVASRRPETRPAWRCLLHWEGVLLFLAILVPWYAAMEVRFPGFLRDHFFNEQIGHVLNQRYPLDSDRTPTVTFWLQHLVYFLPWTFFLPAALRAGRAEQAGERLPSPSRAPGWAILRAWVGVTLLTLVFSSLQDYYTMTCWGAAALWLARPWATEMPCPRWRMAAPGILIAAAGLAGLAAAIYIVVFADIAPAHVAATNLATQRNGLMKTISGFRPEAWAQLMPLLWAASGTLLAAGAAVTILAARSLRGAVVPVVACAMVLLQAMAVRGMSIMEDDLSLKNVALAIDGAAAPDALVYCQGIPSDHASALYYLNREIHWLASPRWEFASRELKIGASLFSTEADFPSVWNSSEQVFLICEEPSLPEWRSRLALTGRRAQPLARSGSRVLLCNKALP